MDLATVIGLVLATALVVVAIILGGSPAVFINVPSLMIVIGGTIGATFMKNKMSRVFATFGVAKAAFFQKLVAPKEIIDQVVSLSRKARKESLLSLEKEQIHDDFLAKGVRMAVDGMEPDAIRTVLDTEISFLQLRHKQGQDILEGIGESAPAFGMIGTLIGLVQMLAGMDDPRTIGPSMAVAILTTLYGALVANVLALPLANKLKIRSAEETLLRKVVMQGILSIVEGDHPASVEQKLVAFVSPKERPLPDAEKKAS